MDKLGAKMLFQLLKRYGKEWDVFNYNSFNGILPISDATNLDMVDFLAEKEIDTWGNGIHEDTLREYALDLIWFLDIAVQDARRESLQFQPIPLVVPDPNYGKARIFHHYFAPYRMIYRPSQPLFKTSNYEVVEFILKEHEKEPIPVPIAHEQEEEQNCHNYLVKFLASYKGQRFLNSIYA